jgi:hypothetical protein
MSMSLVSCLGIKPGGVKGAGKLYESFYVGEEGVQYYIKPIKSKGENFKIAYDFTFRYKDEVKDSTTLNLSVYTNDIIRSLSTIQFKNSKKVLTISDIDRIFSKRDGKGFVSRFSMKCETKDVKSLFEDDEWEIIIKEEEVRSWSLKNSKSNQKSIRKIDFNIFSTF